MKKLLLPLILILLAGCDYKVPLSQKPAAKTNPALAGRWIEQKDASSTNRTEVDIKVSGADYSVAYIGDGCTNFLFSGFEVESAGFKLIQLKLLTDLDKDQPEKVYVFIKYELTPDGLSFCQLNKNVVSSECQTMEELRGDLKVHRKNPALFTEPRKFTKSVPQ